MAFRNESEGEITAWKWDFGDGSSSVEQNLLHAYQAGRDYTEILDV